MYKNIEDYGIIGNCRSCALVSDDANIEFCCLPNFDSNALFCSLLDEHKGGYFKITPRRGTYKSNQRYKVSTKGDPNKEEPNQTNILKTFFFNQAGNVVVTDFMPITIEQDRLNDVPAQGLKIVRKVKSLLGDHEMSLVLKPTPEFVQEKATIRQEEGRVVIEDGQYVYVLYTQYLPRIEDDCIYIDFELKSDEDTFFSLAQYEHTSLIPDVTKEEFHEIYRLTEEYWEWWMSKCNYSGKYTKEIQRSALALKLLTFRSTGAILAAATTSLPEKIGGPYNWDYRFTWLRDASFTLQAFIGLGYLEEAERFFKWLESVCLLSDTIPQIMYGIHGERDLEEHILDNLEGYKGSAPVRTGNAAAMQLQFDIFGEILQAVSVYIDEGAHIEPGMQSFVKKLVDYCCVYWKEKDASIWEGRSEYAHHTYSKLSCWVGIDKGIKIAKKINLDVNIAFWEKTKHEIKKDILENGYNEEMGTFIDTYGSDNIDASLLAISLVGFLPANDPKVLSTLEQVMQKLVIEWFVLRTSDQADELKQGEGAFFMPTLWLIDNLTLLGRTAEARVWLDKILHTSSPLGLYAEEFDPFAKVQLGNFPQAYTHLSLINSILMLESAIDRKAKIAVMQLGMQEISM